MFVSNDYVGNVIFADGEADLKQLRKVVVALQGVVLGGYTVDPYEVQVKYDKKEKKPYIAFER